MATEQTPRRASQFELMASKITKYRERLQHQHGWEVELKCPMCGSVAVPVVDGWTSTYALNFGNTPTIFANVRCTKCSAGLKDAAGLKLIELFADVPIPERNRRLIFWAVMLAVVVLTASVLVVLGLAFVPKFLRPTLALVVFTVVLMRLYFIWYNWQVTSLRHECECGNPAYKFMGLLGRSYCYRCSSCSKRLRLRD